MTVATAARTSVLVVKAADRAAISVTGKDRLGWLNGLVTQELGRLGPGDATYSLLVEKKGKIQSDLYVIMGQHEIVLAVPSAMREALVATLDHYLIMEDVELTTPDLAFYLAHGPKASEVRAAVNASFAGALDLLGTGGVIMCGGADLDQKIAPAVSALGGALGDEATWEALRIERGLPRFGVEVDGSLYPQEASLEKLGVSFQKGCYLGQEVVYMLENRGHVKKRLVPLDLEEGDDAPDPGAEVTTPEGDTVGDVRSAAMGPLRGRPVAIAMVKWAQAKGGTALRVAGRAARVRASDPA
jgi:tRNA-modifying protein YgfZ